MDLNLTIPLWPLAALLSIVVAGLASAFVAAFAPAHPLEEKRATFGQWVFWVASIAAVGWWVRGIWILFGYPQTADVIALLYTGVCVLYWLRCAWHSIVRRVRKA